MKVFNRVFNRIFAAVLFCCASAAFSADGDTLATEFLAEGFVELCAQGSLEAVAAVLDAGIDVNAADEEGFTPLMSAAANDNAAVIMLLIQKGAKIDARDNDGWTALMFAARRESGSSSLALLIASGADVNARDDEDWPPLMFAARSGNADAIRILLDKGADVGVVCSGGQTPLMYAAYFGNEDAVRALLKGGADIALADEDGDTALDYARYGGMEDTLAYDALYEAAISAGMTPERRISDWDFLELCKDGSLSEILDAIENGANVNAADDQDVTALMYAARYADAAVLQALIYAGADVDAVDFEGSTALMYAAWSHTQSAAAIAANIDVLLKAGADPSIREFAGRRYSALDYLEENGLEDTAGYYTLFEAYVEALHEKQVATKEERYLNEEYALMSAEEMRQAIAEGLDVNEKDSDGGTVLMYAAAVGEDTELVQVLLDAGADVNATAGDEGYNLTALMAAIINRSSAGADIVKLLVEAGADVNVTITGVDEIPDGVSLLMLAAAGIGMTKNIDTIPLLLEAGADAHARDSTGKTALDYANEYADDYDDPEFRESAAYLALLEATLREAPPPTIANLAWTDENGKALTEAHLEDTIYASANAARFPEGAAVTVIIFEYNEYTGSADDYVTQFEAKVHNGRIRAAWNVLYDEKQTGTKCADEVTKNGYTIPQYRFRIRYAPLGRSGFSAPLTAWDWVRRRLIDDATEEALSNHGYTLTISDGTVREGTTNDAGYLTERKLPVASSISVTVF